MVVTSSVPETPGNSETAETARDIVQVKYTLQFNIGSASVLEKMSDEELEKHVWEREHEI
jgi:hypothetical protein